MVKKRAVIFGLLLIIILNSSGCNWDIQKLIRPQSQEHQKQLIKVQIFFTDDETITGYVKGLGIEENGRVYVGGSSLNYLYDANGTIVGAYNYQRVLYMKIISGKTGDS